MVAHFIRQGYTVEQACELAGIGRTTFYAWLSRGSQQPNSIYGAFVDAIKKAEAESELLLLQRIEKAAERGQWQAAAWMLERRFPKLWGRNAAPPETPERIVIEWGE